MGEVKNILLSLIGRGKVLENISQGYKRTSYRFKTGEIFETGFFGSALWKYISQKEKINYWYIFGTSTSSWSEIIYALDEQKMSKFQDLAYEIYEAENIGIKEDLLKNWEKALSSEIPGIKLILIDPLDYKFFSEFLLENLPENDDLKIILDITHGYRYLPLILSFSIMYVKNFKNIKELKIYYGALEMSQDNAPVLEIDHINEIFQLSTAFELYKNSGYFPELLKNLGLNRREDVYFSIEMNERPREELEKIIEELESIKEKHKKVPAKALVEDLIPLCRERYLEDRMVERAKFFFKKKQYLKSLILLYEALTIIILKKAGYRDLSNIINRREKAREVYSKVLTEEWTRETFNNLEKIRNSAVHGNLRESQSSIRNFEDFSNLFQKSLELYHHLRKSLN
ncbi:MAG: TIGR02221 family CRISPR-associated protein [Dictyoglomus thermophilum]|uniref:TIGR02221 family CRISPR-associated protein n=1 Tax=Dictyoglomus thermophilum TaxID=14 RepID=A0A7V4DXM6_DICTH|nr:TIGR02221 family CRISPR-associated protein [Dictyoglomus thermophilum]MCX7720198.1 TIGR02221 family CRISPR-associated protein [Dictyoglomus thermophilum]TYT23334.1 TIGR02221 family CRISPR-associated protein [Dictyoglomus thermophilum]